ncbi:MAG: YeeE/YedE family protein [Candidatus Pelagibacterales bacterium]|nr:MAG: YeeE/YedE family protein [Pelagibacterales bacterium]
MNKLISLVSGIIFGFGLTVSSMTNPAKVLGFLDLFGHWDPSLIFVMIGAIIVSSPFFFLSKSKRKPLFAQSFSIPEAKKIDTKLIFGSSLFGIGWGSVGLCPGPAISSLALLNNYSLAFIVSMFLGFLLAKIFN